MNSGVDKCICKIYIQYLEENQLKYKAGTGFFYNIKSKNIKVFITNNHVLNQNYLDSGKYLKYIILEEGKEIEKEINIEN